MEKCEDRYALPDMTGVKLSDLLRDPDSKLGYSVRRLVKGLNDPNGVISAFSSFVE